MLQKIFVTLSSVHSGYSPDFILLKSERSIPDPEYVLYFDCQSWCAIGPVDYVTADKLVANFMADGIRSFISCEEEFVEKGLPRDYFARNYFPNNELNW
jgi:hypothetical protein